MSENSAGSISYSYWLAIFALFQKRMTTAGGGPVPAGELLLDRFSTNVKKKPSKKIFSFIVPGLDGGRIKKSYTYNELAEETSLLAQRLLEAGLKRGDR